MQFLVVPVFLFLYTTLYLWLSLNVCANRIIVIIIWINEQFKFLSSWFYLSTKFRFISNAFSLRLWTRGNEKLIHWKEKEGTCVCAQSLLSKNRRNAEFYWILHRLTEFGVFFERKTSYNEFLSDFLCAFNAPVNVCGSPSLLKLIY